MIPLDETFDGTFPFAPQTFDGHGFVQHYVDEGPREATETLVCLHGEPTWGYLYRHMIEHLGLRHITLVGQDWGGPIAAAYTMRHSERVRRIVFANTLAGVGQVTGPDVPEISDSPWFRWIAAGLENGRTEAVLRNAGSTVLSVMKIIGFQNSAAVDDTWIRAYSEPFPDWDSAIGAYEFPLDVHSGRIAEYVLAGLGGVPDMVAKPALLLEGLEDRAIPPAPAIADFRSLWPDAPVVEMAGVGHFCQEDAPDVLVSNIEQFIQSTS